MKLAWREVETVVAAPAPCGRAREPRLDLFRGLAMLIIFVAHIPWNFWAEFIPARWGPSDATEMFVFCSGYAAAIAFGGTFARAGFAMGGARILLRCWQIYWAHLGLFFTVLALTLAADAHWPRQAIEDGPLVFQGMRYAEMMNFAPVFERPEQALVGLFTLRWVPYYFDIMPMYMAILLMVPVVMALQRVDSGLAIGFVIIVYVVNRAIGLHLPAEPWSDRDWYFNPFAWQLLFFTGFAIGRGWISPPGHDRRLIWLAALVVTVLVPICQMRFRSAFPALDALHERFLPGNGKTDCSLIRYVHFLALAYLATDLLRGREWLLASRWLRPVIKVGQQALPSFLTSMVLAWAAGMLLDHVDRSRGALALVNLGGLATVMAVAHIVGWYKGEPWRQHRAAPAELADAEAAARKPRLAPS